MVELCTNLRLVRDAPALVPATALDMEELQKLPQGRPFWSSIIFSRSVQHNRWYRALVSLVAGGIGMHPDALHAELKFKAGKIDRFFTSPQFGTAVQLKSTAFRQMDEAEFREYTNTAVEIIFIEYLPGVDRKGVFDEVERMVGPRY